MWVEERDRPNLNNMLERALVRSVDGGMSVTDITTPSEWILDESVLDGFVGKVPQYVIGRGLTLKTCKFWELGYDEDPLDSRLVFPVRDYVGSLVGMVGRALTPDARIKYRNYSGFHGANFLYGEDKFDPVDDRPIVLVEGMLDVLMSWQHGICQPLGIFGSRLTRERARKLEVLVGRRTILTLFDPDKAGSDARKSVDEHLGGTIPVFHRECPEEKDPGDLDKSELESILNCS
jgi:5S rRNA maturation endonuclease (ribonuclease M5)